MQLKRLKLTLNILSILLLCFLALQLFLLVKNNIQIVSETNRSNFSSAVKIREVSEELDVIVERAEVGLTLLSKIVRETYDLNKKHNKAYNEQFLNNTDIVVKALLKNSPGVSGSWLQMDVMLPFSSNAYLWYIFDSKKQIVDFKKQLELEKPDVRILNPQDDSYYFEALNSKDIVWSDVYIDKEQKVSMITLTKSIYKNGELIGVAGVDVSTSSLRNALKNMQKSFPESEIFLLDKDNKLIFFQLPENSAQKTNFKTFVEELANKLKTQNTVEYKENGISKTAIKIPLSNKYAEIITFPNSLVYDGFDRLFNTVYLIFAAMIILVVFAAVNKQQIEKINKHLEKEKNTLRTVIDSSPNMILLKDLSGTYLDCNDTFLKLKNIKKEDVIGKNHHQMFTGDELLEIISHENTVRQTKSTLVTNGYYSDSEGNKVYVEKYIVPLLDKKKEITGFLIIGFDQTNKQKERDLLRQAKEEAERAAMIKSNFLANMSHEIRTPMNGLLGFIQLLDDTNLNEEQREYIGYAQKASESLLQLLNDILDFSKIEADKLKIDNISFNVRSVVEDATLLAATTAQAKGLDVNALISSGIPQRVIGDPGRVKQVLSNLINNSIKFTNMGEIIISVMLVSEDDESAVLKFEVSDTGIGIEEDKLSIIFHTFTQVDSSATRKFGGTGLGLAISKKLVNLMGGDLSVESLPGKGSTFSFSIPFAKDKTLLSQNEFNDNSLEGLKILCIDNNFTNFKVIQYYLDETNCIITNASSIEEINSTLESSGDSISTILIDNDMQIIEGIDIVNLIKNNPKSSNVPLILYTSLAKRGDAQDAKEKGFAGYLTKPFKKQELIDTIKFVVLNNYEKEKPEFVTKHFIKEMKFSSKAKILIVEDCDINSKLIAKILSLHGLNSDFAVNGKEAIKAFKNNKYDLILMDCQMPVLDGYSATKAIRQLEGGKDLPIIAMTANVLAKDKEKCLEEGMDAYIGKPIDVDEFLLIISNYIKFQPVNKTLTDKSFDESESEYFDNFEMILNTIVEDIGLNKDEAIELLSQYLKIAPSLIEEIQNAIISSDFALLKELVHKLKGSSANLRIRRIAELSSYMESAAIENNSLKCVEILNDIKNQIGYLCSIFVKFVH